MEICVRGKGRRLNLPEGGRTEPMKGGILPGAPGRAFGVEGVVRAKAQSLGMA